MASMKRLSVIVLCFVMFYMTGSVGTQSKPAPFNPISLGYALNLEQYLNANLGPASRAKIGVVSEKGIPAAVISISSLPPDLSCGKSSELLTEELDTKIKREGWVEIIAGGLSLPVVKIPSLQWEILKHQAFVNITEQISGTDAPLFDAIGNAVNARFDHLWNTEEMQGGLLAHVYQSNVSPALAFRCGVGRTLVIDAYFFSTYIADLSPPSIEAADMRLKRVLNDFIQHGNMQSACKQDLSAFCRSFSTTVPLHDSAVDEKQVQTTAEEIFQHFSGELVTFMLTPSAEPAEF